MARETNQRKWAQIVSGKKVVKMFSFVEDKEEIMAPEKKMGSSFLAKTIEKIVFSCKGDINAIHVIH